MAKVFKTVVHEIRELLPAFIFFALAFNVIVITDALTTEEYGIRPFHMVGAIVLALIVAKTLLLANLLPFIDAFPEKPLIYNTLWKTFIYTVFAVIILYIEHLIRFSSKYGSVAAGNQQLIREVDWPRFWAVIIWLATLLFVFTASLELSRKLGPGKLRQMFFGK